MPKNTLKRTTVTILTTLLVLGPASVNAQTTIAQLQAQLAALYAQLAQLQKLQATASANCQFSATLKIGSTGPLVTCLQNYLIKNNYLKVSATGYFGVLTTTAVRSWQADRKLQPTGRFEANEQAVYRASLSSTTDSTPAPTAIQSSPALAPVQSAPIPYTPPSYTYTPPSVTITPPQTRQAVTTAILGNPTNRVRTDIDDVALIYITADSSYQLTLQRVRLTLSGGALSGVTAAAINLTDPNTNLPLGSASEQTCTASGNSCTVTFTPNFTISAGDTKAIKIRLNSSSFANTSSNSEGLSIIIQNVDDLQFGDGITNNISVAPTMVPLTVANLSYE